MVEGGCSPGGPASDNYCPFSFISEGCAPSCFLGPFAGVLPRPREGPWRCFRVVSCFCYTCKSTLLRLQSLEAAVPFHPDIPSVPCSLLSQVSGVTGGILGTLREPGVGDAFEAGPGPVSVWMQPTCVIAHEGGCGSLLGNVKVI